MVSAASRTNSSARLQQVCHSGKSDSRRHPRKMGFRNSWPRQQSAPGVQGTRRRCCRTVPRLTGRVARAYCQRDPSALGSFAKFLRPRRAFNPPGPFLLIRLRSPPVASSRSQCPAKTPVVPSIFHHQAAKPEILQCSVGRTCPARAEKRVVERSRRRVAEQAEERKIVKGRGRQPYSLRVLLAQVREWDRVFGADLQKGGAKPHSNFFTRNSRFLRVGLTMVRNR